MSPAEEWRRSTIEMSILLGGVLVGSLGLALALLGVI